MNGYACIYFKTRPGIDRPTLEDDLPPGAEITTADGTTQEIDQCWRYYDIDAREGPWLLILKTLRLLLTSPDVERVWYGSSTRTVEECTPLRVLRISEHFIRYGQDK